MLRVPMGKPMAWISPAEVRSIMCEEALEGPGSLINLPVGREGEQGGVGTGGTVDGNQKSGENSPVEVGSEH